MPVAKEFPLSEEYKKDTGITPEDVRMFREWLATQPHLPNEHITDLDLALTLHCCERSTSVSRQVLDLNLTLRTLFHYLYKERVVNAKLEKACNLVLFRGLPIRSKGGDACFYGAIIDPSAKHFVLADAIKVSMMVIDLWQYEDGSWPALNLVFDVKLLSLGHLATFDIQVLQQYFYFMQEAMLVKLKAIHFINAPSIMDKLLAILKPCMSKDLINKVQVHPVGSSSFDNIYPMENLLKDKEGKTRTIEELRDETLSWLKANEEYFALESMKRVTESRRPGKPKSVNDFFGGVEGSFKKLDID